MDLKIVRIKNAGDYDKEYVMLQAVEDCDLSGYLVMDTTYDDTNVESNKRRHVYWFPEKRIEKGEYVSLWTKPGAANTGKTTGGGVIHRFYWGVQTAIWNDEGDTALLFRVAEVEQFSVGS